MRRLSQEVSNLTTQTDKKVTVEGNDEITHLATAINEMFKTLDTFHDRLRQISASLAEAQRIAHVGNWDWDINANHFYCSEEIYRIFGLKPYAIAPSFALFLNYVHPDDRDNVSSIINKAMSEDEPYSVEHRIVQHNGNLRFIHTRGEKIKDSQGLIIHIIGTLQDITERRQAEEETLRLLDENRFLVHRTLAIREKERKELARELHDGFGQYMTAIQADAATIISLTNDQDNPQQINKISLSAQAILDVAVTMYDLVHNLMDRLHPSGLYELGLREALYELTSTWESQHHIACNLTISGIEPHLVNAMKISVYRVVQEALTNVKKYAEATQVQIILNTDPVAETLTLFIQDDGVGLDLSGRKRRGLGLIGMRERAQALDGYYKMESQPKQGVKIIFSIPISEAALKKHAIWGEEDIFGEKLLKNQENLLAGKNKVLTQ